jgi:hypothetical protein
MYNTTITANHAGWGGGISNTGSTDTVVFGNSIIWGNTVDNSYPNVNGTTSVPDFESCIVEGSGGSSSWSVGKFGTDLGNNLDADPLFTMTPDSGDGDWTTFGDNDYGDLSLQGGSPAVDAGNNTWLPADTFDLDEDGNTSEPFPYDLAGNQRIVGGTVDMGALERQ